MSWLSVSLSFAGPTNDVGKKWKPSCTFCSFEDYSWPLSDRWRKVLMQRKCGPSEHFIAKMLKWIQVMTWRQPIVTHDNVLKHSQVRCDVLWQGSSVKIHAIVFLSGKFQFYFPSPESGIFKSGISTCLIFLLWQTALYGTRSPPVSWMSWMVPHLQLLSARICKLVPRKQQDQERMQRRFLLLCETYVASEYCFFFFFLVCYSNSNLF